VVELRSRCAAAANAPVFEHDELTKSETEMPNGSASLTRELGHGARVPRSIFWYCDREKTFRVRVVILDEASTQVEGES